MKIMEFSAKIGYKQIWKSVLLEVYKNGEDVMIYDKKKGKHSGGKIREIKDLVLVIRDLYRPRPDDVFLTSLAKRYLNNMLILPNSLQYERIVEAQIPLIINKLRSNIHTRGATFTIQIPSDLNSDYIPPSIGGQFLIRDYGLSLRILCRSIDVYNGLSANIIGYINLLYYVYDKLKNDVPEIRLSEFIMWITSAHFYYVDLNEIEKILSH